MQPIYYEGVDLFAEDGSGHLGTFCNECLKQTYPEQDVEAENVSPIFSNIELDHYPVCDVCYYVFDYIGLTEYGAAGQAIEHINMAQQYITNKEIRAQLDQIIEAIDQEW